MMGLNPVRRNLSISRDESTQETWQQNQCDSYTVPTVISDKAPHEENQQQCPLARQRTRFPTAGCGLFSVLQTLPWQIQATSNSGSSNSCVGSFMAMLYHTHDLK